MVRMVLVVGVIAGCNHGAVTAIDASPASIDAPTPDPPGCKTDKLHFTRDTGCANDGSVEFCIPDNNSQLRSALAMIEPAIGCAPGGGRANCSASPGLLLCTYHTSVPGQCRMADHGAMTDAAWADMCAIAAFAAITEIVPTFAE